jgi:hypothetical protein
MWKIYMVLLCSALSLQLCGAGVVFAGPVKTQDPWACLQKSFPKTSVESKPVAASPPQTQAEVDKTDPWQRLREIVIPFSLADDEQLNHGAGGEVAEKVSRKLKPWRRHIHRAARLFQVPVAIIEAVIMVESGGNPRAKAKTSSASGLMQTIKATFAEGRRALAAGGIVCADDPFDPQASILVGSWYLKRMFDQAKVDGKPGVEDCSEISSWRYPLQYYYSGPGHGRKKAPRILIYSGGERILINKPAYSRKVMAWAENLPAN